MKLETYQANLVIVNQNTDPKRHGVCGNDGIISFNPPQLRDTFMAEHTALVAVAEAAKAIDGDNSYWWQEVGEVKSSELTSALANLAAVRAGQPVQSEAKVDHIPLVDALMSIASWPEGDDVDGSFDEPSAAQAARSALAKVGIVGGLK